MAIRPAWREYDLIFPSAVGTPLDPDNVSTRSRGFAGAPVSGIGTCMSYATPVRR